MILVMMIWMHMTMILIVNTMIMLMAIITINMFDRVMIMVRIIRAKRKYNASLICA